MGNGLERQARQHLDDIGGGQGIALVANVKHQKQALLGHLRARVLG